MLRIMGILALILLVVLLLALLASFLGLVIYITKPKCQKEE